MRSFNEKYLLRPPGLWLFDWKWNSCNAGRKDQILAQFPPTFIFFQQVAHTRGVFDSHVLPPPSSSCSRASQKRQLSVSFRVFVSQFRSQRGPRLSHPLGILSVFPGCFGGYSLQYSSYRQFTVKKKKKKRSLRQWVALVFRQVSFMSSCSIRRHDLRRK
ncbi:hypothetical protein CEXT_775441 [Caerostris extrusa]|uniref:Uncharacterized protein n=1 Tax=Caerostris extrusa TaxID=172846 RepID=A0AAV4QVC2_CAEEX|nr:hypothetical protein CEXT_775441 [Caerostris extrusa]